MTNTPKSGKNKNKKKMKTITTTLSPEAMRRVDSIVEEVSGLTIDDNNDTNEPLAAGWDHMSNSRGWR